MTAKKANFVSIVDLRSIHDGRVHSMQTRQSCP